MVMPRRNDPCFCSSGKKYKKCCYLDEEKNNELARAVRLSNSIEEVKKYLSETVKTFVLKIELLSMFCMEMDEEISCLLEINGKATLYDVHLQIQKAFDWDNDHIFSFYLGKDMNDRKNEYSGNPIGEHMDSMFGEPTKPANGAEIRDLNLFIGKEFMYLFDYGDQLLHRIKVEDIQDSKETTFQSVNIILKIGKAPEQYDC